MNPDIAMASHHDHWLVALSILITILGAYAARELVQRMREAIGWTWLAWLFGGAMVDGVGTWSMHFTGMLALRLPVPLLLDWRIVLLSLTVSIIGSAGALVLLSQRRLGWPRAVAASIVLGGVGISGLHFTAMAAIRMPHFHHPDLWVVALSILLAIVFSLMAIVLAFLFGEETGARRLKYHGSTWLRGLANPVMHYTAMAAVIFTYSMAAADLSHAVNISALGLLAISLVPLMLLVVLLLTSQFDRLRRQKELLKKIFDHIPVMISFFDQEGRIALVNREWERKRGLSMKQVEELGPDVLTRIYPDPEEQQRARAFIAAASGEWSDFRSIDSTGQAMDTTWANVRLSDGTSLSIGQDVTERRRAEESLRESEERFRQFAENLQDVIWLVDSKVERLLYINPAYEKVWGLPRESVYQNVYAFTDPVHPDDREIVVRMLEEQRAAKPVTAEYRIIRPDGALRWIRGRSFPIRNAEGEVYRVAGVAEDITEKKQADERLREYEKVVEGLEEMIIVVDRDYRYLIANRAFLRYRGVSREELLEGKVSDFMEAEVFEKETKWRLDEAFGGQVVKYELRYNYPTLGERDMIVSYFPIEGPNGIDRVACVLQDATDKKVAEYLIAERVRTSLLGEEIGLALTQNSTLAETLQRCAEAFVRNLDGAFARIWTVDQSGQMLELQASAGLYTDLDGTYSRIPVGHLKVGRIAQLRQPHLTNDLQDDPKVDHPEWVRREGLVAFAGYPLVVEEHLLGVIALFARHPLTTLALEALASNAAGVALGIKRSQTEEALRRSEALLRSTFERSAVGIALTDLTGRFVRTNRTYQDLLGYSEKEFDSLSIQTLTHPDELARTQELLGELIEGRREQFEIEKRFITKTGAVIWVRSSVSLIRDQRGEPQNIIAIVEDITERKQAEAQLRASSEQLRALSARLQAAREEEGTRIAREIHDELGSALTILRWDLESLDKVISESGDHSQNKMWRERIESMLKLTETTIGSVRRISSELRPSVLDDLGLVEAIEWQAQEFQDRTGTIVAFDCTLENVDLSREQSTAVFRIFQEALTNIIRHAQATKIDIALRKEANHFELVISDNGRGITEEEKLSQRSLGLLGIRERAHLINATVEIVGIEEQGTQITVRVPRSDRVSIRHGASGI